MTFHQISAQDALRQLDCDPARGLSPEQVKARQEQTGPNKLKEARKKANAIEDIYRKAVAYHEIAESLADLRKPIDKLEDIVDNKMWPLPKYRELLFIS